MSLGLNLIDAKVSFGNSTILDHINFIHTNRRSNSNYWTCRIGQIGPVQIYSGSSRRTETEIRIF